MLRLVLDTNVVLDLFRFADPAARALLAARDAGRVRWLTDAAALDELARVVGYPKLGMDDAAGAELQAAYRQRAEICPPPAEIPPLPRCKDRDDQKFLELAASQGADLLVSKDKALLKLRGRKRLPFAILTPAQAAERLA